MTNFLTVKNPDAEANPNELEYRRKGKDMATQAQYDKLIEDNELAFFRADVRLGSPEFQGKLLDMLCASGRKTPEWWKETLFGAMPDSPDEL